MVQKSDGGARHVPSIEDNVLRILDGNGGTLDFELGSTAEDIMEMVESGGTVKRLDWGMPLDMAGCVYEGDETEGEFRMLCAGVQAAGMPIEPAREKLNVGVATETPVQELDTTGLTVVTWNVNSIRNLLLRYTNQFKRMLGEAKTDVLCLQEMKMMDEDHEADR